MSKLKLHEKFLSIRRAVSEVSLSVYGTTNQICVLDINAHNDQSCTEIEAALLYSAKILMQNAPAVRSQIHTTNRNNGKYIGRLSNDVTTDQIIANKL